MRSMTPMRDWTIAQHFAIWIGAFTTVTGLIGLVINRKEGRAPARHRSAH